VKEDKTLNSLENRQTMADAGHATKTPAIGIFKRWLSHKFRIAAFSAKPLRRLVERKKLAPAANKVHWDALLSDEKFSTYLGGTINVDGTNTLTALMLKYHSNPTPAVLDVACSGGTLLYALPNFSRYLGVDVSSVAIEMARRTASDMIPDRAADIRFDAADLRQFDLPARYDVMVFNEVLYYLTTDQAVDEVRRYAKSLNVGGLIVISMKDDGKSRAIFKLLAGHFAYLDGILWQRKPLAYDFKVRPNRECPAWLVTVFQLPAQPAK
jgi:2-polyprenyl-3-methyl-5-hydroxy-6-metoxy-1,4-benzoquinol methylase